MKILSLILLLSFSSITTLKADETLELKPFVSDYCSAWPEGTSEDRMQWAHCCFTHDLNYWIGGTENERKEADKGLRACVKLSGASLQSFLMYMGVRAGGRPGNASFAWGFGWSQERGYERRTTEEIIMAKKMLEDSPYSSEEETAPLMKAFIEETLMKKLPTE